MGKKIAISAIARNQGKISMKARVEESVALAVDGRIPQYVQCRDVSPYGEYWDPLAMSTDT